MHKVSFRCFEPESEVPGIPFVRMFFETGSDLEFVEGVARKSAIAVERSDIKEDISVRGIGMSVRDEFLDDSDHLRDMGSGAREELGR